MRNFLAADELGDAGEDLFQSLCSRARLTCNKSNRDRTGWDFRVEFPLDTSGAAPLDRRMPRVCQIQVKSTAGDAGSRVPASLSSIDRLAKDAAPSAIVVFRLRRDGTPMMGYVIHLIDDALGRILRRLRLAQADGRSDLNKMLITFDYLKGRRFKPTPEGLREALAEVAAPDVSGYATRKRDQLASLGYEEGGGLEVEALLQVDSPENLGRMFSGLQPLKPIQLVGYDRRFGIRIPYRDTLLDEIQEFDISLPSAGAFDVIIKNGPLCPAALFQCEAFVPPPVGVTPLLVIRHTLITILFYRDRLEVETNGAFISERYKLEEWTLLLRGLAYLASGNGTVELSFKGIRVSPARVGQDAVNGPYLELLPHLLEFVGRWRQFLDLAGIAQTEAIAVDDILQASVAQMAMDMIFNPKTNTILQFDVIEGFEGQDQLEAIYFNSCHVAGTTVSFAVRTVLQRSTPDQNAFSSVAFYLLDARAGVVDIDEYGANIANTAGLTVLIDPQNVVMEARRPDVSEGG